MSDVRLLFHALCNAYVVDDHVVFNITLYSVTTLTHVTMKISMLLY